MSSVTARIKAVKQPRGGYIKPSMFESIQFDDENVLFSNENVHASIVGMVVDYMTRFVMTSDVKYSPITVDGFTFEHGYTDTVDFGDGDFLTADTLWDYKVSKTGLKNTHTLQLLMYYIMGKHSGKPEFDNITKIGAFNPRLNIAYALDVKKIPSDVITVVEHDIIGY